MSQESQSPAVLVDNEGPVRILTLNRPERRNSLNLEDRIAFLEELREAESDPTCRAVVVTGAGKVFCSGGDISSMSSDPEVAKVRLQVINDIAIHFARSSCPVVTAVNGGAYGLGLALVTASDYSVVADDGKLCASFAKIGLTADSGLFWSLRNRVGAGRARELILFATVVPADEALRMGLISEVAAPADLLRVAVERARQLAEASAPMIAVTKQILAQSAQDLESVLAAEAEGQAKLLAGADFAEGRAAFFAKRKPSFTAGAAEL